MKTAFGNKFSIAKDRKTLRCGDYPQLEDRLYQWFLRQRKFKSAISMPILKAKAIQIFNKIKQSDDEHFTASIRWFDRFKKRYGLRNLTITGEQVDCDMGSILPFKEKLKEKIAEKDLKLFQIYNADETGLYWKLLPRKTYVSSDVKKAHGDKVCKDRITALLCTNADGSHKITPLTIDKSKNPRPFKNFILPLNYTSSTNAWMIKITFKHWFFTTL